MAHHDFVTDATPALVANSAIVEVTPVPFVSPLLVVLSSSGKKRLILDLRNLNQHVWKAKFKFDDWQVFRNFLSKGGFVFSCD